MENAEKMRHTLSHVLAAAVQELYPTTTFGIGPAIENGFYYDIDFETKEHEYEYRLTSLRTYIQQTVNEVLTEQGEKENSR